MGWASPRAGETIGAFAALAAAMPTETPSIAAVVYRPTDQAESFMAAAARALAARGVRLGGVVQHNNRVTEDAPCAMELEDLASGTRFALSQSLGRGSEACRLDPEALARAAVVLRGAIEADAELLIVNKFGGLEAGGGGLRAEMGLAALAGIPLLTAVGERYLAEWDTFTGGAAVTLPLDVDAIVAWWSALPARP